MSFFGLEQPDLETERRRFLEGKRSEDVAVYEWGTESYDGLGESLQEGGDELNDETFGSIAKVGKDFDFANSTLDSELPRARPPPPVVRPSLESIWDDKSPFSVLSSASRLNGAGRSPLVQPISHGTARTVHDIEAEMLSVAQNARMQERMLQQQLLQQQQQKEEEQILYLRQRQREEDLQRLRYQQEHEQRQRLLQQRELMQRTVTPPRMLPVSSQSPRFLEHQRQLLLLQQQQEQQQLLRIQELQEQLRMEELERQLRAQQISQLNQGPLHYQQDRYYADEEPRQMIYHIVSQNAQMQQRLLLSEMAQAEFLREMQGSPADQEALRAEAMRKILQTEKMEEKRRRKARYNDLMTQSDKDFITRIQVSQLVTQDPYADDFYAQVYGAILRSRLGQTQDERVLKFGSGLGVGLGVVQKGNNRRPNAMQRMEQQVERIVSNARRREEEKGMHSGHSLQGALGRTSGRSYKAAPRQLLNVDANSASSPTLGHTRAHSKDLEPDGAAAQAAKLGKEALGNAGNTTDLVSRDPLTQREILICLENVYDLVLRIEQLRRDQPLAEDDHLLQEWQAEHDETLAQIWTELKVMVPIATSDPHPFVSLMSASKGMKLLPRLTRHLNSEQMQTILTLLTACFGQLEVVTKAPLLDNPEPSRARSDIERQTATFLNSVLPSIYSTVATGSLRLVTGLLGLLLARNDIRAVARTKPGVALLTLLITRVENIKEMLAQVNLPIDPSEIPTNEDAEQWRAMFDHLFELLSTDLPSLFPSTRRLAFLPAGQTNPNAGTESLDQPVWQLLATLACHGVTEQHQILVTSLREKVLENVIIGNKGWVVDEEERQAKLANVNLFLHALGLDSSQIAL
ncbi:topoisomerase II-associated protein PAT1 [Mycena floridula]|nr:topoisomerase II-associated protein PAT1 [Mycena floridula]